MSIKKKSGDVRTHDDVDGYLQAVGHVLTLLLSAIATVADRSKNETSLECS
jgi:hypothetical protein